MPITFAMNHDGGYLEILYKGQISDAELLSAYKSYFDTPQHIEIFQEREKAIQWLTQADIDISN